MLQANWVFGCIILHGSQYFTPRNTSWTCTCWRSSRQSPWRSPQSTWRGLLLTSEATLRCVLLLLLYPLCSNRECKVEVDMTINNPCDHQECSELMPPTHSKVPGTRHVLLLVLWHVTRGQCVAGGPASHPDRQWHGRAGERLDRETHHEENTRGAQPLRTWSGDISPDMYIHCHN